MRSRPRTARLRSRTIQVRGRAAWTRIHERERNRGHYVCCSWVALLTGRPTNTHPDKVAPSEREAAHVKFQSIALAYAILSSPSRRARYDSTGSTSDSIVDSDGFSWSDFYRAQYADAVSAEAIAKIAAEYKGSEEERADLLAAFDEFEGDMDAVYSEVMLSSVLEDDERFRSIIDAAIKKGEVKAYPKYTKETKKAREARVKAARTEAKEAEEYAKELGVHDKLFGSGDGGSATGKKGKGGSKAAGGSSKNGGEDALAALIRRNQENRASFLDNLAAKYGATPGGSGKKKGKKRGATDEDEDDGEPSEEAFQAAAARLKKNKAAEVEAGSSRKKGKR